MTRLANPYVGPRSFTLGEEFYGRDRELHELVDLLIAERIVLLYSPSGAGKTSLVQAGLVPAFLAEGFEILPVMRVGLAAGPGNRYVQSCISELDPQVPAQQRVISELTAPGTSRNGGEPNNELLIFDQFEEILTVDPVNRTAKEEFFARIGGVLRDRNRWALFIMREDYVAALSPYLRPIPTRLAKTYRLDLLGVDAALAAIQEPAAHAGIPFATDAARKLVDDLRVVHVQLDDASMSEQLGDAIEPVQLQVVCRRIWDRLNDQAHEIGAAEITAAGDVDSALGAYYADNVARIAGQTGVSERSIRDWFEYRLITEQGIRGQVLQGREQSEGLDNRALDPIIKTHLLRPIKRSGATWFELAHDRLTAPIRKDNATWRETHLSALQKQAMVWDRSGRPAGLLVKDKELADARRWATSQKALTPVEQSFLDASNQADHIRQRETFVKLLWIGVGALVIVAGAAGAYAAYEATTDASRQLAAESEAQLHSHAATALDLARQAFAKRATPQAGQALELAIQMMQGPRFRGHTDVVNGISFSPDGTLLASASDDKTAKLWDVQTGEEVQGGAWSPVLPSKASRAVFSPDGTQIAIATIDGSIRLVDVKASTKVTALLKAKDAINDIAFSRDAKFLAWVCQDGTAGISSKTGTMSYRAPLTAVAVSPGGETLVAGASDGTLMAWMISSGRLIWSVRAHGERVTSIVFAPDGSLFASAGDAGTIFFWDATNYNKRIDRLSHSIRGLSGISFSSDGTRLASAGLLDGLIRIWDVKQRTEELQLLPIGQEQARAIAFAPGDRDHLAVAADNSIRWYDLNLQRLDARAKELLSKPKR